MLGNDRPDVSVAGGEPAQVEQACAELVVRIAFGPQRARIDHCAHAVAVISREASRVHLEPGRRDVPALQGWRKKAFGADALRLCEGKLALKASGQFVEVFEI